MSKTARPHILKPNKAEEFPHSWVFVDTESTLEQLEGGYTRHNLKLGWACYLRLRGALRNDTEEWLDFTEKEVFWSFVESKATAKSNLMLCAHNVVYDYIVLDGFRSMAARGWEITKLIADRGVAYWILRQDKKKITVLDSLNIFKDSLERIGESIGCPKMDLRPWDLSEDELSLYCQNDVLILVELFKFYKEFLHKNRLGNFAPTAASQALNAYRHRFMPQPIYSHLNERIDNWEHEGYFGGRCEIFRKGEQPEGYYHLLDINSLYPSVMYSHQYPVRYLTTWWKPETEAVKQRLAKEFAIAHVTLHAVEPAYPKLHAGKLLFPIGDFETVLPSPELEYALEHNAVREIKRVTFYERADLFSGYVGYFYDIRQQYKAEGKLALAYFTKILLNSLYGKFGQRSGSWETLGNCSPDLVEFQDLYRHDGSYAYIRMFAGLIQQREVKGPAYNSLCAIAAGVTSAARMKLWDLLREADLANVYYCDTDSLIVNEEGLANLQPHINPTRLGALRIEGTETRLILHGAKDYEYGSKRVLKGISTKAVEMADNVFFQEEWPSLAGLMRAGTVSNYYTKGVQKRLLRTYDKGTVLPDGRVIPLLFLNNDRVISGKEVKA